MAKKTRRVRHKSPRRRLSDAQLMRPSAKDIQETVLVEEEAFREPSPTKKENFSEEYYYVVKDLQRIGLLAAAMLGGLVILSLVL